MSARVLQTVRVMDGVEAVQCVIISMVTASKRLPMGSCSVVLDFATAIPLTARSAMLKMDWVDMVNAYLLVIVIRLRYLVAVEHRYVVIIHVKIQNRKGRSGLYINVMATRLAILIGGIGNVHKKGEII